MSTQAQKMFWSVSLSLKNNFKTRLSLPKEKAKTEPQKSGHLTVLRNLPLGLPWALAQLEVPTLGQPKHPRCSKRLSTLASGSFLKAVAPAQMGTAHTRSDAHLMLAQ